MGIQELLMECWDFANPKRKSEFSFFQEFAGNEEWHKKQPIYWVHQRAN